MVIETEEKQEGKYLDSDKIILIPLCETCGTYNLTSTEKRMTTAIFIVIVGVVIGIIGFFYYYTEYMPEEMSYIVIFVILATISFIILIILSVSIKRRFFRAEI